MVADKGSVWSFTGTTKDESLKDAIEAEVEDNPDLRESDLVREAVREYLGGGE